MDKNKYEEFVIFRILEQEFCIEMQATRELRSWTPSTSLPNSDEYVVGIINLRGNILPIVDLAVRLGFPPNTKNERRVIIVVQHMEHQFGLLVDDVSDIISISPDQVRPVPTLKSEATEKFFKQVIVMEKRIICQILLDQFSPNIDKIAV